MSAYTAAIIFSIFSSIVIIFQACLAAGMPWGAASMGGKFPGKYPPKMRVVALVNILVLVLIALIVLVKAEIILLHLFSISKVAIWFVVGFSALGTVLNTITPSKIERIWAPVAAIQLITSLVVALS